MKTRKITRLWKLLLPAVLASQVIAGASHAQSYPSKPVRVVVGFAPGGASDIVARILAQKLGEVWGQTVVVENRPGASGIIGADAVARAAPDGYTLLVSSQTSTAVAPSMYVNLPYDALKDFAVVTVIGLTPMILVVHPSLPTKTFQEFVPFAKAHAKDLSFGSSGHGGTGHLAGELLNLSLGIRMTHVPYKGEPPALTDVIGGNLSFMFPSLPAALPLLKSGRLRGLGVASLKRSPHAMEYPTIAESGIPGFETVSWNALYAPAALPKEIVARLNADAARVLQMPDAIERLGQQGVDPVGNSSEQATAYLKAETEKWAKVIKAAGLRPQ